MARELVRMRPDDPAPLPWTSGREPIVHGGFGYGAFLEAEQERIDLSRIGCGLDPIYVATGAGCPLTPAELEWDRAEMVGEGVKR